MASETPAAPVLGEEQQVPATQESASAAPHVEGQEAAAPVAQETVMQAGSPYRVVGTGELSDPTAVQVAAVKQQQAMYTGFGLPYALNSPSAMAVTPGMAPRISHPQTPLYQYPGAPGAIPLTTSFYNGPTSVSGPCYYDPYGMLNPAACFAPVPLSDTDPSAAAKKISKSSKSRGFCC
ncbi:hypothetical protein TGME49_231160 [Toxoplasma gondii ME49]|uniref:Uncharacterized protein n=3 Tax=Toxoplasma gondii TaxID=5811 RepID=B6KJJ4_TOXGV|nr:hypothetical protein TGME49_231160 [Toxoplasma gondii ME49]EPT28958.1 hypothetical protein TGME49_231160 [Toxoplasma gondii ME49]ESS35582.1 hypothetical protein TGVEG_231160 [Toxoplasma gondii VEG]KYF46075.1 hypothetical protein TGARI_231160 [Toxoplasma gondii ARI]CEL74831.1 TPA: hypothetical protein BN1205_024410 [Toxoplasma gondii VEG]|eukprot:XP_018636854.1 hypothetical protein TGME49_231160 [Toxoplasma gondii ME49]